MAPLPERRRRNPVRAWLVAVTLLAASASSGCGDRGFFSGALTGVTLSIDSASILAAGALVDVFVIDSAIGSAEPTTISLPIVGRPVQSVESVNLLYDDEDGGTRVFLDVTAFREMGFVASGSTDVELVTGEMVPAGVVLSTCEAADGPFCDGMELVTCDSFGLTERTDCGFGCNATDLRCNACNPDTQECSGDSVIICDANGEIDMISNCGDAPATCFMGGCVSCTPDSVQCLSNADASGTLVMCDTSGGISASVDCNYGCDDKAGTCYDCYPGNDHCIGSDLVECFLDGTITSTTPCMYGCADDGTDNGACNSCTPAPTGTTLEECHGADLVTCDDAGGVTSTTACTAFGCNTGVDPDRCDECDSSLGYQCIGDEQTQCSPEGLIIGTPVDCGPGLCNPVAGQCNNCTPGQDLCTLSGNIASCNPDGTIGPVVQACSFGCNEFTPGAPVCNACVPAPVGTTHLVCDANDLLQCDDAGMIVNTTGCGFGCSVEAGADDRCNLCTPSTTECSGADSVTCTPDGFIATTTPCAFGCNATTGACNACTPNTSECQGSGFVVCDPNGNVVTNTDCTTLSDMCNSGVCTPGGCTPNPLANGTPCTDGLTCTTGDTCQAGTCTGGGALNCDDMNDCTADVCDEGMGGCVNDNTILNGVSCNDSNFCTNGETCSGGACGGGLPNTCDDADQCTADTCDSVFSVCIHDAAGANGLSCNDGLLCTTGETCSAGTCGPGSPTNCNDGLNCTADSCNEIVGCVNDASALNGTGCDDGNFCTTGETCNAGTCGNAMPTVCTDGDPCTVDSCNSVSGMCEFDAAAANGNGCNDGDFCTIGTFCTAGTCGGGTARDCGDGDPCTTDSCDSMGGACLNNPAPNGTACDDSNFCTNNTTCTAGVCGGGTPTNCDDGVDCTLDSCAGGACVNDPTALNGSPCDSGSFCFFNETCSGGACGGGTVQDCDDGDTCTSDICDFIVTDACQNTPVVPGTPCEDGLFCTINDSCNAGGVCTAGGSTACIDGNPCTTDSCDEVNDACVFGNEPAGTSCLDPIQEATCDGMGNTTSVVVCSHGCNSVRDECNECAPSSTACQADIGLLCNAEVVCSGAGLITSTTCCTSNRCTCDGSSCLEDVCNAAPTISSLGTTMLAGNTCNDFDNIPGDCNPGGIACLPTGSGGAPEEYFLIDVNDGMSGMSTFYNVTVLDMASAYDTELRVSSVCGSETLQIPNSEVCSVPAATTAGEACNMSGGPEDMVLCGLPEGTWFGAVDSASGMCGAYDMDVTITPVDLNTEDESGNITMGGTFFGDTCLGTFTDTRSYPDIQGINGCVGEGDCIDTGGGTTDCPACDSAAATDCTLAVNSSLCAFSGVNSPEAVFYLALEVDSGVDLSTVGSSFDTVLYIREAGPGGAPLPGGIAVCNDECYVGTGVSHIQTSLPAGLYYVYVDGAGLGTCGAFTLDVQIAPASTCPNLACEAPFENCDNCPFDCGCPNCGDGAVDTGEGEECDDGGNMSGNGCSATCVIEPGYVCTGTPSSCFMVFNTSGTSPCGCAIPDCDNPPPGGAICPGVLVDTLNIATGCTIFDIDIDMDITHTWRGDLVIELTSPMGTTVTLFNQAGGNPGDGADDVVGNFPFGLTVEGPGSLSDFLGEAGNGTWTLNVEDNTELDLGTLNSWGINLTCM